MSDYTVEIKGHALEYYDQEHTYIVDGVIVPSITEILKIKFGDKYKYVDQRMLKRAADAGTAVHNAIQNYVESGERSDLPELRNFIFLKEQFGFDVVGCEIPLILFSDDEKPLAAGRCDLVIMQNGEIGGADIKRTANLDREYLAYQLNLYRSAFRQSYGLEWLFLRGIHLRDDVRRYVKIPINEEIPMELVKEWYRR